MSLDPAVRSRIDTLLQGNRVVLFMKGVPGAPQCGFSAKATGILDGLGVPFQGVNVLADQDIREGIKAYGNWPTIPQLYIGGELIGGSDLIEGLLNSGELHGLLDLPPPDRSVPEITITPPAADAIRSAMADADPTLALHLSIDSRFNAQFALKPAQGDEIVAQAEGLRILFDLASGPRAKGIVIDWVEDVRGAGLTIRNPNAPATVKPLTVQELQQRLAAGSIEVIDVRPAHARAVAPFPQAHTVLDEDTRAALEALPKDRPIAFLCHHGVSSRQAAEHFRELGFKDVYNVEGGIDAWSQQVDTSVPRY